MRTRVCCAECGRARDIVRRDSTKARANFYCDNCRKEVKCLWETHNGKPQQTPLIMATMGLNRNVTIVSEVKTVKGEYLVKSGSTEGAFYRVTRNDNDWTCTCPHFRFRSRNCKHIEEVRSSV